MSNYIYYNKDGSSISESEWQELSSLTSYVVVATITYKDICITTSWDGRITLDEDFDRPLFTTVAIRTSSPKEIIEKLFSSSHEKAIKIHHKMCERFSIPVVKRKNRFAAAFSKRPEIDDED